MRAWQSFIGRRTALISIDVDRAVWERRGVDVGMLPHVDAQPSDIGPCHRADVYDWVWVDPQRRVRVQGYNSVVGPVVYSVSHVHNDTLVIWGRDPFTGKVHAESHPPQTSYLEHLRNPHLPVSAQAIVDVDAFLFGLEPQDEHIIDHGPAHQFRVVRATTSAARQDYESLEYTHIDVYSDMETGAIVRWDYVIDRRIWISNRFDIAVFDVQISRERFDATIEPDWHETDADLRHRYGVTAPNVT